LQRTRVRFFLRKRGDSGRQGNSIQNTMRTKPGGRSEKEARTERREDLTGPREGSALPPDRHRDRNWKDSKEKIREAHVRKSRKGKLPMERRKKTLRKAEELERRKEGAVRTANRQSRTKGGRGLGKK